MGLSIIELFRRFTGYPDREADGITNYVLTSSLIPTAEDIFESLTLHTISIDTSSYSSGENVPDVCLAHLSGYLADTMFDRVHIDPETGQIENRHWNEAMRLMLAMWGVRLDDGTVVLPGQMNESQPSYYLGRVDSQLKIDEGKDKSVKTYAAREKYKESE